MKKARRPSKKAATAIVGQYVDQLIRFHLADALMGAADAVIAGRRGFLNTDGPKLLVGPTRRRRKAKA